MDQTRMLHNKNCHSCPIFAATTRSRGTGIAYIRLPSESKTSGGSVVRALSRRYSTLCDSAARSQRMPLSLSLSTCTCHAGMVHSHLHGTHLHIQSLAPVRMPKKQAMSKKAWDCHRCCTLNRSAYRSSTHPTAKQTRILPTTDKADFIYTHKHVQIWVYVYIVCIRVLHTNTGVNACALPRDRGCLSLLFLTPPSVHVKMYIYVFI